MHLWGALAVIVASLFGVWRLVGDTSSTESLAATALEPIGPDRPLTPSNGPARPSAGSGEADPEALPERTGSGRSALTTAAAPVHESEQRDRLSGRVIDREGAPVAGATVYASTSGSWYGLPLDVEAEGLQRRWHQANTDVTDAEGRYRLAELDEGKLSIVVRARGFVPHRGGHGELEEEGLTRVPDIRLESGERVAGRVIDPAGEGVAGVSIVCAVDGASSSLRLTGRGVRVGETEEDGSFVVDELEPGPWRLLFDAEGYRIAELQGRSSEPLEQLVRLEDGLHVSGRVLDIDPAVATTLRISARKADAKGGPDSSGGEDQDDPSRARHAPCDPDGGFHIGGLEPLQRYRLTAWMPMSAGGGWRRAGAVRTVLVEAGDTGIELEYQARAELTLRVLDDATGDPLEELGVWVGVGRLRPLRDDEGEPIREHADGHVLCPQLVIRDGAPPVHLRVSAPGYTAFEDNELALEPGEKRDLGEIRLARAAELVVRVVADHDGEPIADARVVVSGQPREGFGSWATRAEDSSLSSDPFLAFAYTAEDGRASVAGVPGNVHAVAVAEDFLAGDEAIVSMPAEGNHEHELRLRRGGSVIVRVVDPAGAPIARVGVVHRRPGESLDKGQGRNRRRRPRTTDDDGTLVVSGLEPGVHGFRLEDTQGRRVWDDQGTGTGWLETVVNGGETNELEFVAPARGGLAGVVTEAGMRLEEAVLRLSPEGEGRNGRAYRGVDDPLTTRTDHEGRYEFEDVRAGRYTLFATHDGRSMPERFEVELMGTDRQLDVDLATTTIEGQVTDPNGEPLEGVELRVEAPSGAFAGFRPYRLVLTEDDRGTMRARYDRDEPEPVVTGRDGRYVLQGVAAEEDLEVRAVHSFAARSRTKPLTLMPGEARRDVDFELAPAGVISIRLKGNATGSRGWFRVKATLLPAPTKKGAKQKKFRSQSRNSNISTWKRRRKLESVRPGRWRIELLPERGAASSEALQQKVVEVRGSRTANVVFEL
jgi:hypothetical protein